MSHVNLSGHAGHVTIYLVECSLFACCLVVGLVLGLGILGLDLVCGW